MSEKRTDNISRTYRTKIMTFYFVYTTTDIILPVHGNIHDRNSFIEIWKV